MQDNTTQNLSITTSDNGRYGVDRDDVVSAIARHMQGVGVDVRGMSASEALAAAGLDWSVSLSPFRYGLPSDDPSGKGYHNRELDAKVAYRSDTGEFIDIYLDREPWQNADILNHFSEFCSGADLELSYLGSISRQRKGALGQRKMSELFAIAHLKRADIGNCGDIVDSYLMLRDSHINGKGTTISLFDNRKVCSNGMIKTVSVAEKVIPHIGTYNRDKVQSILEAVFNRVEEHEENLNRLAEAPALDIEEARLHLVASFGVAGAPWEEQPKLVQTAWNLYQGGAKGSAFSHCKGTPYQLLQSVTETVNWERENRGQSELDKMRSRWNSLVNGRAGQQMNNFERQLVSVYASR